MRTKSWATAGIVISWSTFWMFLFSPFGLLAWIGIFIYLVAKKATLKWYFIFSAWLFVPSCNFVTGTVKYFRGTACLQGVGGPQTYHGIDRETRVASRSSGCILVGFEPFVFPANNAAVRVWTNLFGFQRGSYIGAFPTEAEAQEIIASADTITIKRSGHFWQFNIAGQTVKVDTTDFYSYRNPSSALDKVIGKAIKDECFIFQRLDNIPQGDGKAIYIVEIRNNKLLRMYSY